MHNSAKIALGVFLMAVGALYLCKPNLFRRGHWMKTGIAERNLSADAYIKYARGVGVFHIVVGIAVFAWAFFSG